MNYTIYLPCTTIYIIVIFILPKNNNIKQLIQKGDMARQSKKDSSDAHYLLHDKNISY